jgi:hypothetical protein
MRRKRKERRQAPKIRGTCKFWLFLGMFANAIARPSSRCPRAMSCSCGVQRYMVARWAPFWSSGLGRGGSPWSDPALGEKPPLFRDFPARYTPSKSRQREEHEEFVRVFRIFTHVRGTCTSCRSACCSSGVEAAGVPRPCCETLQQSLMDRRPGLAPEAPRSSSTPTTRWASGTCAASCWWRRP